MTADIAQKLREATNKFVQAPRGDSPGAIYRLCEAEIEVERAAAEAAGALDDQAATIDRLTKDAGRLGAEVLRLQGMVAQSDALLNTAEAERAVALTTITAMQAEIEGLKVALRQISDETIDKHAERIAARALLERDEKEGAK